MNSTAFNGTLPIPPGADPGAWNVTLVNNGGNATLAEAFTVSASVPVITALSPKKKQDGSAAFTLTVTGSGFLPDAPVRWKGADRKTHSVSLTRLTAKITANLRKPGSSGITVRNPEPGGIVPNSRVSRVVQPAGNGNDTRLSPVIRLYPG